MCSLHPEKKLKVLDLDCGRMFCSLCVLAAIRTRTMRHVFVADFTNEQLQKWTNLEHEVLRALKIHKHLSIYYLNNFRFSFLYFAQLVLFNFSSDLDEPTFDEKGDRVKDFIDQFEKDVDFVKLMAAQYKADQLFSRREKLEYYSLELSDCISLFDPTQRLHKVMLFLQRSPEAREFETKLLVENSNFTAKRAYLDFKTHWSRANFLPVND